MAGQGEADNLTQEIADIFSLGSVSESETPAAPADQGQEAPAVPPAQPEAGEGVVAPSPSPAAPPAPSTPASPAAPLPPLEQTPASGATPAAPAAPAAPTSPVVDERDLQIRSLQATVDALQKAQQQPQAAPAAGTTPAAPGGNDQDQPEVVPYGLTIPDAVTNAIFGEDPVQAKAALNHLMSSLASVVHTRALHQVRGEMRAEIGRITQQQSEAVAVTAAEDMQKQFFSAFPQYENEVYRPILASVNAQLAAELPNHPWDENYINALGQRMHAHMAKLAGGTAPAQPATSQAAPAPAVPPKPAAMVPAAPRDQGHSIPSFERDLPDQVSDIFAAP